MNHAEQYCTNATITPNVNYTEINAGWSLFPVAYLPGTSTFDMNITSGKFEGELFTMASGSNFTKTTTYLVPAVEHLTPSVDGKVVLANVPATTSIHINGLTEVAANATLKTGEFQLDSTDESGKTIKFYNGDAEADPVIEADIPAGAQVEIMYEYEEEALEAKFDNRSSSIGEAIMVWPVYPSADDCSVTAAVMGYVIVRVYRARITSMPGFDSSYKSANTFQFSLSAINYLWLCSVKNIEKLF